MVSKLKAVLISVTTHLDTVEAQLKATTLGAPAKEVKMEVKAEDEEDDDEDMDVLDSDVSIVISLMMMISPNSRAR